MTGVAHGVAKSYWLIRAAIEPSPTARDRGSGGAQEEEADDGPAKAVVSVSNTEYAYR